MKTSTHLALLAGGLLGVAAIATSAVAKDYDEDTSYSNEDENYSDQERIEVTAPRLHINRDHGLNSQQPLVLSTEVSFNDLDLRTRHGARILTARVRAAARSVCTELEVADPGSSELTLCFQKAAREAIEQANDAITEARSYAYDDEY